MLTTRGASPPTLANKSECDLRAQGKGIKRSLIARISLRGLVQPSPDFDFGVLEQYAVVCLVKSGPAFPRPPLVIDFSDPLGQGLGLCCVCSCCPEFLLSVVGLS